MEQQPVENEYQNVDPNSDVPEMYKTPRAFSHQCKVFVSALLRIIHTNGWYLVILIRVKEFCRMSPIFCMKHIVITVFENMGVFFWFDSINEKNLNIIPLKLGCSCTNIFLLIPKIFCCIFTKSHK
jgi:hypothetical protein